MPSPNVCTLQGMIESTMEASSKRAFNGVDPVEAGRRGGIASGLSRRLRPQRELARGITESKNGQAKYALLRDMRRDEQRLLDEQRRADELVCRLLDEADQERATIARL